jgi:hypothetical protein
MKDFGIPLEPLELSFLSNLDSQIISNVPTIFTEFEWSDFPFCGVAILVISVVLNWVSPKSSAAV